MTLNEAMAIHGPAWLSIWLPILLFGSILLPLSLLIWKETRVAAIIGLVASVLGMLGIGMMYERMGYVRLLGLPHIIFWTPLAFYFWNRIMSGELRQFPRIVMMVSLVIISISLAFDYVDVIRYIAGEKTPLALPASLQESG